MQNTDWTDIEFTIQEIDAVLAGFERGHISVTDMVSEIRESLDTLYALYADSSRGNGTDTSQQYEEIIAELPNTRLSLGEMLSLKEAVQQWRNTHG